MRYTCVKLKIYLWLLASLICLGVARPACGYEPSATTAPYDVSLPTALPSGSAHNDQVWFTFYPAVSAAPQPTPAVVLLPYLGASNHNEMHVYARYLAARGMAAAVMILPYHTKRALHGVMPWKRYVGTDVNAVAQAFAQSASDVSTMVTWLSQQPSLDAQRIGIVGISLGAIIAHLAMGKDERIRAGVALLGGGDLWDIYQRSLAGKLLLHHRASSLSPADIAKLRLIDPLTYAHQNRPRHVLMIQAARDAFIPPHNAEVLWKALGQPPIQWLDVNHLGILLAQRSAMEVATTYLQMVWSGREFVMGDIPHVHVPTIKAGFLIGLDSLITPAIQWQALSLGTRQHRSLIHADLGWSGRGPFAGVSITVSAFSDLGLGRRFDGDKIQPYAAVHVVF